MKADIENGYTRIANDIMDALAFADVTLREMKIILVIIRRTYGFQKKSDWIALDQFVEATGIAKENISRILSSLVSKKIIEKEGHGYIKKIAINTQLSDWVSRGNIVTGDKEEIVIDDNGGGFRRQNVTDDKLSPATKEIVTSDKGIVASDNKDVSKRQPQKKKENITKERKEIYNRKTKIPDGFCLDDHKRKLATEYWKSKGRTDLIFKISEIFEKFLTYCKAHGKKYSDWNAAWTTWYCNQVEYQKPDYSLMSQNQSDPELEDWINARSG